MTPFGDAKNPARGLYGGLSGGLARVTAQAVTPEQLLPYVGAVSGLRPRLFGDCVGHTGEGEVVLVGYPLHDPRDTAAVDAARAAGKRGRNGTGKGSRTGPAPAAD